MSRICPIMSDPTERQKQKDKGLIGQDNDLFIGCQKDRCQWWIGEIEDCGKIAEALIAVARYQGKLK